MITFRASRSLVLILASVATVIVSMLGLTIQGLGSRREEALENARRESLARASLIAARLDATLRVASGVLEAAATSREADAQMLAQIASRLGEVSNVYRVDRNGRIRASAFRREADTRLFFPELALLSGDTGAQQQVGIGQIGGEGREPALIAARRIDDASGAYDGIVLATFGPEILDDRIALLLGYALDRISLQEAQGENLLTFTHDAGATLTKEDEAAIVASTALSSAPFRLAVSVSETRILEPWRHYARDLLVAELSLVTIAGGLGLAALLNRGKSNRMRKLLLLQAGHTFDAAKDILSQSSASALRLIVDAGLHALEAERASLHAPGLVLLLPEEAPEDSTHSLEIHVFPLPAETEGRLVFARKRAFSDEERLLCKTFAVLAGLAIEVGRRREAEASLGRAFVDKNALFQELNHRVKNNLALVQTFIEMGSGSLDCDGTEVLRSASARIQAIALVHEQLYAFASLETVEFGPYLARLAGAMLDAYAPQGRVEIGLGGDGDLWMGIQEATAIALIANELIMNAIKHAFPADRRGHIQIDARRSGECGVRISIADDGVGMRVEAEATRRRSMGMSIMQALASQLKGTLEFGSNAGGGTSAVLTAASCLSIRDGETSAAGMGCS